ncbi:MAG: hypothetical protein HRU38_11340 [Saccharospirillaceae bacterium]|nr:hypothetical protein [Pseudomonadales bacterium]NRB79246.1 hypothetical protein [Saccharospirillaceae bacterium]
MNKLFLLSSVILIAPIYSVANGQVTNQLEITSQVQLSHKNENDLITPFDNAFAQSLAVRLISDVSFDNIEGQFHLQLQQNYSDPSVLLPVFSDNEFRLTQINNTQDKVFAQIDRANISFATGDVDWIVGRQPISVGVTRMASISQIYQSNYFVWNSSGYGYGVDALNLNYHFATNDVINAVVFLNQLDNKNSMFLLRYQSMLLEQDVSIMLQKTEELVALNTTIDAYVGNYALWSELSLYYSTNKNMPVNNQFRITIGGDYYLKDLYGQVEYHFNSFGCATIKGCTTAPMFDEYQYTGQPLANQQYLYVNNSYPVTDLSSLVLVNIINLNEPAIMNQIIWSVSMNDHFDWTFMFSNAVVFSDDKVIKTSHEFSYIPLQATFTAQFYF